MEKVQNLVFLRRYKAIEIWKEVLWCKKEGTTFGKTNLEKYQKHIIIRVRILCNNDLPNYATKTVELCSQICNKKSKYASKNALKLPYPSILLHSSAFQKR